MVINIHVFHCQFTLRQIRLKMRKIFSSTRVNSRLTFVELIDLNEPEIESQWFLIRMERLPRGINSIILGTIYRPPQSDDHVLRRHILNVWIPYLPPILIPPFWFLVISINLNQVIFAILSN